MSIKRKALAEGGTPTYVTRFDGVRVPATDYHPVWLDSLADDVTLEGSARSRSAVVHDTCRTPVTSWQCLLTCTDWPRGGAFPTSTPTERSLIEFTNTCGLRHPSGSASLSGCSVTPNPGPSGPSA
jgi:hypothetical protein